MKFLYWDKLDQKKQITEMREDKEGIELQLCKTLYEIFSEKPLLQVIQLLAHYAILDIYEYGEQGEVSYYLGKSGGKYRLWKSTTHKRWKTAMSRAGNNYEKEFGCSLSKFITNLQSEKDPNVLGQLLFDYLRIIKEKLLIWLFDPGDCEDILTMYAEFLEESADPKNKPRYPVSSETFAKSLAFVGRNLDELRAKKRKVSKDQEQFFRLFKKEVDDFEFELIDFFSKAKYRKRTDLKKIMDEALKKGKEDKPSDFTLKLCKLIERAYLITPGVVPGLARFRLGEESSLKQVDKMFGLRKGGDISGTTADTIFAIEALLENFRVDEIRPGLGPKKKPEFKLSSEAQHLGEKEKKEGGRPAPRQPAQKGDPQYQVPGEAAVRKLMGQAGYRNINIRRIQEFMDDVQKIRNLLCLLPVASMGYQGHHTILECAVTLTMNDYTDYHLGLYTTLLPRAWWETKTREGEVYVREEGSEPFERVKKLIIHYLDHFERHKENHWMVLSFSSIDSPPVRCIVFEKYKEDDCELFRLLSWLSMNTHVWLDKMYDENKSKRYADDSRIDCAIIWWESVMQRMRENRPSELRAMSPRRSLGAMCQHHVGQRIPCPKCRDEKGYR